MSVITAYAWIHTQINDGYYYQKSLGECYNKRQNVANTPPLDEVELDDQYSFNDQLIHLSGDQQSSICLQDRKPE